MPLFRLAVCCLSFFSRSAGSSAPELPCPFVQSTLAFFKRNISSAKVFTGKQQLMA
jgi:UDP-N-acetylmuramyl pentapeptide phosphotransferase/UDP-N-acetylglucosamine-1-phosphate transferase